MRYLPAALFTVFAGVCFLMSLDTTTGSAARANSGLRGLGAVFAMVAALALAAAAAF